MVISVQCVWTFRSVWLLLVMMMMVEVMTLSGPNVCMVKQKYNITKRIKYRAPMSVRTYEWCFSVPPRCSRWNIEMRDLTKLETEERTAEVAVCCPGYKMKDVSCVPICPNGKTGPGCSEDCPPERWGPNCVNQCKDCSGNGACSPVTGECVCRRGWQGESCESMFTTTTTTTPAADLLTPFRATKPSAPSTTAFTLITTPPSTTIATTTKPTSQTTQATSSTVTTQRIPIKPLILLSNNRTEITTTISPIGTTNLTSTYRNITLGVEQQTTFATFTEETTQSTVGTTSIYNRTEIPVTESTYPIVTTSITTQSTNVAKVTFKPKTTQKIEKNLTKQLTTNEAIKTTVPVIVKEVQTTTKAETTRKAETTIKIIPTTIKFKPKEIWIRPAQKGESPVTEIKAKMNHDAPVKYKNATKIEILPNTTPKTIIVSIIPTSVSYATFKKIALTTASYLSNKNVTIVKPYSKSDGVTKSMSVQTSTAIPSTKTYNASLKIINVITTLSTPTTTASQPTAPTRVTTLSTVPLSTSTTKGLSSTKPAFVNNTTNSMTRTTNAVTTKLNSSNSLTTIPILLTNSTSSLRRNVTVAKSPKSIGTTAKAATIKPINKNPNIKRNITEGKETKSTTVEMKTVKTVDKTNDTKINVATSANSKTNITVTTDKPQDEETFHILTEPEHITAVMSEKGTERSSVDLISVISIAGGVMMAIITVAVVIVMIERCKKPRYEDVRKINDIRMQVMIDNNDIPPSYVRSIFHTPLPDPPNLDKCHYQPISTLDRNLKQFMRPVVVQTISPVMLENFRGILECHYDHLPRRSHEYVPQPARCSVTPSIDSTEQLNLQRSSLTESAIEAMKCEAKLDVIDTTTSEPLYAEIPCWRPPSEHAIEIMNLNGEAVTEL